MNEILASPVFRARDTAELAFGEDQIKVTMDLVADEYAGDREAMIEATKRLLRTLPGPGMNRVLVGHRMPLEMATGRMFPDSVLPEGNGRFPSQCDSAVAGNDHGRTCRALGRITGALCADAACIT